MCLDITVHVAVKTLTVSLTLFQQPIQYCPAAGKLCASETKVYSWPTLCRLCTLLGEAWSTCAHIRSEWVREVLPLPHPVRAVAGVPGGRQAATGQGHGLHTTDTVHDHWHPQV